VTDINMPGMTGIELHRAVRDLYPDLAVIMVTAVDDHDIALDALKNGAYGYVVKPVGQMGILIHVANALRRRELEISNRSQLESLEHRVAERTRDLEKAYADLQLSHGQLLQQEKMATIGQLAAGVAHEINNPTGFISSNLNTLNKYAERLTQYIQAQEKVTGALPKSPETDQLNALCTQLKIDHIMEDAGELISECLEGTERIGRIVQGLKSFSRKDRNDVESVDINALLDSTLNIVWNELKYKATVEKEYGELLQIECYPQQLSQVFMNLLVNAGHAIESKGLVTIRTWADHENVYVKISDTGCGIKDEDLNRIFEAFFTTKEVGKGTGLGLSIASEIIKKHRGAMNVESEVGKGTVFTITLPLSISGHDEASEPGETDESASQSLVGG